MKFSLRYKYKQQEFSKPIFFLRRNPRMSVRISRSASQDGAATGHGLQSFPLFRLFEAPSDSIRVSQFIIIPTCSQSFHLSFTFASSWFGKLFLKRFCSHDQTI